MSARYTYRVRADVWDRLSEENGWATTTAAAQAIGVSIPTMHRILRGQAGPGPHFMASVMIFFSDLKHEDIFEITPE